MYEAFYGLEKKPFSMLPDPDFLYLSKKHQAALTLLEYGMLNHAGFCVISGEPGAGKTTIIRALLKNVGDDVTVGLITNTHRSFGGLLDWILSAFNLHQPNLTQVEMHQVFMDFVINEYANNRSVLLIVDEAQNMSADALEELRMLSNVNSEKDQLMQIILAGQPALKEMLITPELMQFAQRIAVDYHLDALSLEETCGYIQHRLKVAGAKKDVFTPASCARIHSYSGGTPRLINLLCETVMVYGFADQVEMIDVELVDEMVRERMKDSVVPILNREIASQGSNVVLSKELEKNFPWISPRGAAQGQEPQNITEPEQPQVIEDDDIPVVDDIIDELQDFAQRYESSDDDFQADEITEEIYASNDFSYEETASDQYNVSTENYEIEEPETTSRQYRDDIQAAPASYRSTHGSNESAAEMPSGKRKNPVRYGLISVVLGVTLAGAAIVLNFGESLKTENIRNQLSELKQQFASPDVPLADNRAGANAEIATTGEVARAREAAAAELARAKAEAEAAVARAKAEAEAEIARAKAEAERARAAAEQARAKAAAEARAAAKAKAEAEAALASAAAEAEAATKARAEAKAAQASAVAEVEAAARAKANAELLKQQREAALAKLQEEKIQKEKAAKLAAEKAASADKLARKKKLEEQQRIARAKDKERLAKLEAEKAAELERQRLVEKARMERQKRLEQEAEARRLEREWYEQQRQALLEAEAAQMLRMTGGDGDIKQTQ